MPETVLSLLALGLAVAIAVFSAATVCLRYRRGGVSAWTHKQAGRLAPHGRQRLDYPAYQPLLDRFALIPPARLRAIQLGLGLLGLGLPLGLALAIWRLMPGWPGVLIGITLALVLMGLLPRRALTALHRRRMRRLEAQLPDFLMGLAAALRAGAGLQVALRQMVQQCPRPLSQEMDGLLQAQRMGLSFDQALARLGQRLLGERTSGESVQLLVCALRVAAHSGGQLAETLDRIATTLRQRLTLQERVQALTSQGRMQAWIMAALPLVLAGALYRLDPQAMSVLWQSPPGWAVLAVIAVLEICGWRLIRRIVNIDV